MKAGIFFISLQELAAGTKPCIPVPEQQLSPALAFLPFYKTLSSCLYSASVSECGGPLPTSPAHTPAAQSPWRAGAVSTGPSNAPHHPPKGKLPAGMGWGAGACVDLTALSQRLMLDHPLLTYPGTNVQTLAVTGKPSKGTKFNCISMKDPVDAHCSREYGNCPGGTSVALEVDLLTLHAAIPAGPPCVIIQARPHLALHYRSGVCW